METETLTPNTESLSALEASYWQHTDELRQQLTAERENAKKATLLLTERSLHLVVEKDISSTLAEQVHQLKQQLEAERKDFLRQLAAYKELYQPTA